LTAENATNEDKKKDGMQRQSFLVLCPVFVSYSTCRIVALVDASMIAPYGAKTVVP
jgi:hypothetical protein